MIYSKPKLDQPSSASRHLLNLHPVHFESLRRLALTHHPSRYKHSSRPIPVITPTVDGGMNFHWLSEHWVTSEDLPLY